MSPKNQYFHAYMSRGARQVRQMTEEMQRALNASAVALVPSKVALSRSEARSDTYKSN